MKPEFSAHMHYIFQIIQSRDGEFVRPIHSNVTVFNVKKLFYF